MFGNSRSATSSRHSFKFQSCCVLQFFARRFCSQPHSPSHHVVYKAPTIQHLPESQAIRYFKTLLRTSRILWTMRQSKALP